MSKKCFSLICSFLALFSAAMAIFTVTITSVHYVSASEWGLVAKLPTPFWIGLLSLLMLIYIGRKSKGWMTVVFILTITYLYVVPTLIQENATLLGTSYPAAEGELIGIDGKFVPDKSNIYRYHNFPGFLYLVAVLTSLTNVPLTILSKYTPLLTITFYGLSTYLILRVKLKAEESLMGATWFLSSFWVIENYFSPQSISFISFLLIFLIVTWLFLDPKVRSKSRRLTVLIFIFFIFSVLTHVLSPIMTISYFFALLAMYKTKAKRVTYTIGILFLLIESLFLLYEAYPFLEYATLKTLAEIPNLFELQFRRVQQVGSFNQILTNTFRISIMTINGITAVVFISLLVLKQLKKDEKYWVSSLFGLSALAFISAYGQSEMLARIYMFALIPLSYMCIKCLAFKKSRILCIIVCVLLILHIPAHYGGASFEMVTTSEIVGATFYLNNIPRNAPCFSLTLKTIDLMWFQEPASVKPPHSISRLSPVNATAVKVAIEESKFVIYSQSDVNQFLYYQKLNPINISNLDQQLNRVYDNPYIQIYEVPQQKEG